VKSFLKLRKKGRAEMNRPMVDNVPNMAQRPLVETARTYATRIQTHIRRVTVELEPYKLY